MKSITVMLSFLVLMIFPESGSTVAPSTEDICLTDEEKLLYSMIMEYRRENNLPSIPISSKLTKVAKVHAVDLATNYDFSPNNECNPHSWSKKGNWTSCCYTSDHKRANCMWDKPREIAGYAGSGYEIAYYSSAGASAREGLDGWKVSPGHNPLLINSGIWKSLQWRAMGVAIYKEYGLVWFGDVTDDLTPADCK